MTTTPLILIYSFWQFFGLKCNTCICCVQTAPLVGHSADDSSDQCLFTRKSDPLKAFLPRGFWLRAPHHFIPPCLD